MSDFMQDGVIATLHKLRDRPIDELEAELVGFSRRRSMTLVLPSLFSELEGEALPRIVDELEKVPYLAQIVIGLDRATEDEFQRARAFFERLPQPERILWNDGPRLRELDAELAGHGLAPTQMGKGRNVWYCFGYSLARGKHGQGTDCIGLHDCDILTYDRYLPARLFYPVADPTSEIKFSKGYYSRINKDRLSGRVTRLFVLPLIRSLRTMLGANAYLEYLDSFRYPLSGEFALRSDVVESIRIPDDWGLEVGVLSEVYRNLHTRQICQVDIADAYDHKHQDLSAEDAGKGLSRMSTEIAKSVFRKLATEGVVLSSGFIRTLKATYLRTALDMLGRYKLDASINGLQFDCHGEEQAIENFIQGIITAGAQFLDNPLEVPFIPNWARVFDAVPDFSERFLAAVEADNA
ncbi:MAG: glycosyl transferase [Gammaproteobacteria bacterium]|nr:glycosyl transferase [Gammaproteobacteria bacterium]